ncbi:peptidoglycan-binding protein [Nocardioides sp. cx-169]|uniref:peptidoglycan-binding protein n=1 Tax=Nocardioides sp. cx-169 TaxID=2899080 RepID=UPI001E3EC460|nr:peptidoglycan-binding domain-containing protein [Nocardioides sp. cx-169]MCD4536521.1 peptidoglycan-binding protein [Nocardioides sp. cx-169]
MRLTRLRVAVGVVVLALVGGGSALAVGNTGTDHVAPEKSAVATVAVTRGTVRQSQDVTGEVGFGAPVTVTGRGKGIITWLPSAGATVKRGGQVYRVNDRPISLLFGKLPLYRALTTTAGTDGQPPTGNDVDLVAANLAALGYYEGTTTDAIFGSSLGAAVKAWQADLGVDETGTLSPAHVVVAAGAVRVDSVSAHLGDDAATSVLEVTSLDKVITLAAPTSLGASLHPGIVVPVALTDGTRIKTRVVRLGAATTPTDGSPPSVAVVVRAVKAKAMEAAGLGTVTATIVTASRKDVLHVPLAALLALSGGGYALEHVDHTLVPVTIGMVADGEVEVSGVAEGTRVVVAR